MQPPSKPPQLARFGVFEADLVTGELRKSGVRVKLQEQPFRVLALLLTNHGQLVPRDQLRRELWSDSTFVDFDQGLATAIRKIREVVGDAAENPRFVETLPKRGYRFIAPVEWVRQELTGEGVPRVARIPQTVSHYRILEKLGEGGMGVVYKAEDSKLQRTVALKFLPSHGLEDEEHRARFQREAQAAAALDHPNICTVYEIDEVQGQTFLAMAYLEGSTVSQKVKQGSLKLAEALDIAIQAGEGLRAAHAKDIVHRDIKSANLMVSPQGQVKIMDFGLAQVGDRSQLTRTGTTLGTPSYMSPEQANAQPTDRRSDIWSLGVVLYEMLTGQLPFKGEVEAAVAFAVVNVDPEPPTALRPGLPIEIDRALDKALAKDPDERYQHVEEMLVDLRALQTGEGASVSRRRRRGRRRRPILLGAASVALVALALVAAILTWWSGSSGPSTGSGGLPSVAVLPLTNISEDPLETDYLAHGISEAVTSKLTEVGLRVTPWESARRYGEATVSPQAVARELNVDAVLTGTLRITGDQILTNVALVEAETGLQSWAEIILLPYDDLFRVQLRIAGGVAEKLKERLTGQEEEILAAAESQSVDAYDLYLQGAYFMQEGTREATDVAFEYFTRAVELDPSLAEAHVGLGTVHYHQYFNGWEGSLQSLERAESSFDTALRLNPASMRARRGLMHVYWERGLSEACLIQGREAARVGHPSDVEALLTQGWAYLFGNLVDRGIPLLRKVVELDPVNESAHWGLVVYGLQKYAPNQEVTAGAVEGTIRAGESYLNRFGANDQLHFFLGMAYHRLGDLNRAQEHYQKASGLAGATSSLMRASVSHANLQGLLYSGLIYERLGNHARAKEIWRRGVQLLRPELEAYPEKVKMRVFLACFYGVLGKKTTFLAEAERALAASVNLWELYYLAAVLARTGETERASQLLLRIAGQGRIRPEVDLDRFFETIASMPTPASDAYNQLVETQSVRLREMYRTPPQ